MEKKKTTKKSVVAGVAKAADDLNIPEESVFIPLQSSSSNGAYTIKKVKSHGKL